MERLDLLIEMLEQAHRGRDYTAILQQLVREVVDKHPLPLSVGTILSVCDENFIRAEVGFFSDECEPLRNYIENHGIHADMPYEDFISKHINNESLMYTNSTDTRTFIYKRIN